jgi:iron complex outermembrane receptor protein
MKSILLRRLLLNSFFAFINLAFISAQQTVDNYPETDSSYANPGFDRKFFFGKEKTVSAENFNKGNINSPLELIAGKIPGLVISRPGSNPNEGFDVRLRGLSTVFCSTSPLIVIDDLPGGNIDNLSPDDIESISIMNSSDAAIRYGSAASGGVIFVTTKRGRSGKPLIEYNGHTSAEFLARTNPSMNSSEWRDLAGKMHAGTDFGYNTDWFRKITGPAISHSHNFAFSGGSKNTFYRASVNYYDVKGILSGTGFNRMNGRIKLNQKALKDRLSFDLNAGGTDKKSDYGFAQAFKYASIYNPTAPVYGTAEEYGGYFQSISFDYYNPVSIIKLNRNEGKNRTFDFSIKGTGDILKGLRLSALYSFVSNHNLGGQYFNKDDYWAGYLIQSRQQHYFTNNYIESDLSYQKDFGSFSLLASAGYSTSNSREESSYARGDEFLNADFTFRNPEAGFLLNKIYSSSLNNRRMVKNISLFAQFGMVFSNSIFLSAGARSEGSSMFPENKRHLFPAAGVKMDLSKIFNIHFLKNITIHADYDIRGNQPLPSGFIGSRSSDWYYDGNYLTQPAGFTRDLDIEWEKRKEFDAGINITESDITFSLDYFRDVTKGMLWEILTPGTGDIWQMFMNISEIASSGIELSFKISDVLKTTKAEYNINLVSSFALGNSIPSLSETFNGTTIKIGPQQLGDMGSPGQNLVPLAQVEEGKPAGQIISFIYKGVDPKGNIILEDLNNDGMIDYRDRRVTGNGLPKVQIGIDNNLKFRNWDLNIFFMGILGHKLINTYRALYEVPFMIRYYNLPVTAKDVRNGISGLFAANSSGMFSDYHIEDASFIALHNLSLGYDFKLSDNPACKNLNLYFAVNNLFYISRYKGADPNPRYSDKSVYDGNYNPLITGVDRVNTWPRTRSFTIGVNLAF